MKNVELRSIISKVGDGRTIEGVIPYNSPSQPLPWIEYLSKGCFSKTISESKNIRALYAHNDDQILASTKNGSLKLEDREDGLHFKFELPNTRLGDDTLELVRTGLVDGCSFGMQVMKDEWSKLRDKRVIKELRLFEISLCPQNQAYLGTTVSVRSLSEAFTNKEISEEDKQSILDEINKLNSLLNPNPETEPSDEPPRDEPSGEVHEDPTPSDPEVEPPTPPEEPHEEDHHLEEMLKAFMDRVDAVEKLLAEEERSLYR